MPNKNIHLEAKKAGVQFGQPNAPAHSPGGGKTIRNYIHQFIMLGTEAEREAFLENPKTPELIKKYCRLLLGVETIKDLVRTLDMVESKPVQVNEVRLSADPLEIAAKIINGEL